MNPTIRLTSFLFIGCTLSCSILFSQIYAEQTETVNVSKNNGKSDLAQIFVLGDNVYVVWRDNSTGNEDIYFSKSSDGGLNFNEPVNLSNNVGDSAFPRLQIVGKNIYVTWYDYTTGQSDIYFAKSIDDGNSFEVSNLSDNEGVSYNPWLAAFKNNVYVIWNDETPDLHKLNITKPKNVDVTIGSLDILFALSRDGGFTFDISNLSNSKGFSWNPRISVNQNYVYVVWNEKTESSDEIFFSVSNDNGETFSNQINLSNSSGGSIDAAIEVSENHVYVIWQESGAGNHIFFTMSENHGFSFNQPIKISNDGLPQLTRDTQMVASQNHLFIVWFNKSTEGGVFFVRSEDYGKSFSKPVNLSGKVPNTDMAQIALFQNNLYIIWKDSRLGNSEVFVRTSHNGGDTFGSIINISKDESESNLSILGPQIATKNNKVYAIFEKMHESGSDLFLDQLTEKQLEQNGRIVLQTLDNTISVETKFDKETLDINQPTILTLKFFNASTSELLEHVGYSLTIDDTQGNNTITRSNLLAENGTDKQIITFDEAGPFLITVSVNEIGSKSIEERDHPLAADGIITVVPEFPVGTLIVIVAMMSVVTVLTKFKNNSLQKSKVY